MHTIPAHCDLWVWKPPVTPLTPKHIKILWEAWAKFAPPDAQVALDAAKLRGESWACTDWPCLMVNTYRKTDRDTVWFTGWSHSKFAKTLTRNNAYECARCVVVPKVFYNSWQDIILNKPHHPVQVWPIKSLSLPQVG